MPDFSRSLFFISPAPVVPDSLPPLFHVCVCFFLLLFALQGTGERSKSFGLDVFLSVEDCKLLLKLGENWGEGGGRKASVNGDAADICRMRRRRVENSMALFSAGEAAMIRGS